MFEKLTNWFKPSSKDIQMLEYVDIETVNKISFIDLKKIVSNSRNLEFESYCKWKLVDEVYRTIDKKTLKLILRKCPVKNLTYVKEARDCDDMAFMFKGWLSFQGFGNVTIGSAEINVYNYKNVFQYAHAVNIYMLDDGTTGLIEPQSGSKIYNDGIIRKIRYIRF